MKKHIIVTILFFAFLIQIPNTNTIPNPFTALTGKRLCAYVALPLGTCIFGGSMYTWNVLDKFKKEYNGWPTTLNTLKNKYNIDTEVNFYICCGLGLTVVSAVGTYLFDRQIQENKKHKKELLVIEKKSESQDQNK